MKGLRSTVRGAAVRRMGGHRLPFPAAVVLLSLLLVSGCRLVGAADPPPPETAAPADGPAIEAGAVDEEADREVSELLLEGEDLLEGGQPEEARELALRIEADYPTAQGSGLALWLRARASAGLEDWPDAAEASAAFREILDAGDPLAGRATLLLARARWMAGLEGPLETLFEVPEDAEEGTLADAEATASEWAAELETVVLQALVNEAPSHPHVLPPFLVELAIRQDLAGDEARARELAERALSLSPGADTAERATSIVDGRLDEELDTTAALGIILPESGPPSLMQLAEEIEEGIETALLVEGHDDAGPIEIVRVDDGGGQPADLVRAVQQLEEAGVAAAVGPLLDPLVGPAAQARSADFPLLSPTARALPEDDAGVFSLTAADREASRALAGLVRDEGPPEVTLIHSEGPDILLEAEWFREDFEADGGVIEASFSYSEGATNFEDPLEEVAERKPEAVVILGTSDELELLAPQLFFYEVREIEDLVIFGGESWTSDAVLEGIQARHTEGVYSVTTRTPDGGYGPGWEEFVEAYEGHFQRTLRSPVPALGYDAARLLIHGARSGGGDARRTLSALEEISEFPGATGRLSVTDGRIQRIYTPVRIENQRPVPLTP